MHHPTETRQFSGPTTLIRSRKSIYLYNDSEYPSRSAVTHRNFFSYPSRSSASSHIYMRLLHHNSSVLLHPRHSPRSTAIICAGILSGFLLLAIFCLSLLISFRCRQQKQKQCRPPPPLRKFEYAELKAVTAGFSLDRKIGQGGFGTVYKGVLKDGQEVAVKKLGADHCCRSRRRRQGQLIEFQNEVHVMSHVHISNSSHVVRLLGFCSYGQQRLLVYEYMHNRSLQDALFGGDRGPLNWETRFNIILQTSRALAYLHSCRPPIIHGDIKPSNILLDHEFRPRIADFGLAKFRIEEEPALKGEVAAPASADRKTAGNDLLKASATPSAHISTSEALPLQCSGVGLQPGSGAATIVTVGNLTCTNGDAYGNIRGDDDCQSRSRRWNKEAKSSSKAQEEDAEETSIGGGGGQGRQKWCKEEEAGKLGRGDRKKREEGRSRRWNKDNWRRWRGETVAVGGEDGKRGGDSDGGSANARGTICYSAPGGGGGGEKSDVYSLGVLMLVVVSGRRPLQMMAWPGGSYLIAWARRLCRCGAEEAEVLGLVDSRLQGAFEAQQATLCIRVAVLCLHKLPALRPSMEQVVGMLCSGDLPHE